MYEKLFLNITSVVQISQCIIFFRLKMAIIHNYCNKLSSNKKIYFPNENNKRMKRLCSCSIINEIKITVEIRKWMENGNIKSQESNLAWKVNKRKLVSNRRVFSLYKVYVFIIPVVVGGGCCCFGITPQGEKEVKLRGNSSPDQPAN